MHTDTPLAPGLNKPTRQRTINLGSAQCWATVVCVGPISIQHCLNESCLLGMAELLAC